MKLLTLLQNILESVASDEAHAAGLRYKGHGWWQNAQGESVAQTVDGNLVWKTPDQDAATPSADIQKFLTPHEISPEAGEYIKGMKQNTQPVVQYLQKDPNAKLMGDEIMMKKIGGQKGSNEGGFYVGADGKERYVKFYKDPSRAHAEVLACEIYKDLGLGAPNTQTFNDPKGIGFASEIIDGVTMETAGATKDDALKILNGFAADILTSNWDAIGMTEDNILFDFETDTPHRIDNGGCFMFRAMEVKGRKDDEFLYNIEEWKSLPSPSMNHSYSNVFKTAGISTPEEIPTIWQQIGAIENLYYKYQGWEKYVNEKVPDMDPQDKATIIKMLEVRRELLTKKAEF